jgi:hypothetical protein
MGRYGNQSGDDSQSQNPGRRFSPSFLYLQPLPGSAERMRGSQETDRPPEPCLWRHLRRLPGSTGGDLSAGCAIQRPLHLDSWRAIRHAATNGDWDAGHSSGGRRRPWMWWFAVPVCRTGGFGVLWGAFSAFGIVRWIGGSAWLSPAGWSSNQACKSPGAVKLSRSSASFCNCCRGKSIRRSRLPTTMLPRRRMRSRMAKPLLTLLPAQLLKQQGAE